MKTYDYIIIGSGPAAKQFVKQMQSAPEKSLLVIEADRFGGTCPNYGCAPKAFLEGATRVALQGQRLIGRGIEAVSRIDWPALIKAKLSFFKDWPAQAEQQFAERATTMHAQAEFLDDHTVQAAGREFYGKKIIIAIGQAQRPLTFPGAKFCHTSNDVFSMPKLPKRIAIIGAGYVAIELATLLNAAGAEVTIVQHNQRVLKKFDQELVKQLVASLQKRGVNFAFDKNTTSLIQTTDGLQLQFADGTSLDSDYVINCAGRQPDL
ncbi:MAG: FAD-dependent oxidoreductase [Lactobacillus sp.]|nr:FAD-dependent oxidoreductase [Lactobacillus sp.]